MLINSMWEKTANNRASYPRLQGEQHADVVIIGGGYTGLSTAYHLQEAGYDTVILEQKRVGFGASGRNGGEVLTGYLGNMKGWADAKGIEAAREMWQLSLDAIDLTEHLIQKNKIDCDFVRNGHFNAAYKRKHVKGMRRNKAYMEEHFDYQHLKIVEPDQITSELNTEFYHGGEVDEKSAHFHPLNYALGLATAATKLGAKIFEESEATNIKWKKRGNQVHVKTVDGHVLAKHVVIATNAYAGDINRTIKRSVVPIESIMIATEPLTEEIMNEIIPNNRAVFDTKNLLFYFRRTADHRLAFGGSGRASSKKDLEHLFDNLHKAMLKVYPQLRDAKIEHSWGGKVGFTKSMLPYIGQLKDGTYYAFGYGGHGAAMASMLGKVIAKSIVKEKKIDNPLVLDKLKPIPFHSHHAKGVSIVKFYKQLQDIIS